MRRATLTSSPEIAFDMLQDLVEEFGEVAALILAGDQARTANDDDRRGATPMVQVGADRLQ